MSISPSGITKLTSIPNIKMLLLKAAIKKSKYDPQKSTDVTLPANKFIFNGFQLDQTNYQLYHQVMGWELESDIIHPCYLHSLAFPLHIMLLLLPDFPFPLLGLVHINNQISQLRPIKKTEKLAASCCFEKLELHHRGWLFSITVEFYSGLDLVWRSISTNLFCIKHGRTVEPISKHSIDNFIDPTHTNWQLNTSLGRRYAKVSGDFNPIHLCKWSAQLFGFKQHIIHGMWTKSYCISAVQKVKPSLFLHAFKVNTTFKKPLYLPSLVNMAVQPLEYASINAGLDFKVVGIEANNEHQPLHLIGNIRAS